MPTYQTQADFDTPTRQLVEAETARRPDAISPDYLTAFAMGPHVIGDPAFGVDVRAWRVRVAGTIIYLARADDAGNDWEAESVLLTYDGALIEEVDIAFNQAGQLILACQRPTGPDGDPFLWYYSTNPLL